MSPVKYQFQDESYECRNRLTELFFIISFIQFDYVLIFYDVWIHNHYLSVHWVNFWTNVITCKLQTTLVRWITLDKPCVINSSENMLVAEIEFLNIYQASYYTNSNTLENIRLSVICIIIGWFPWKLNRSTLRSLVATKTKQK